jgi:hypothetical protein
VSSRIEFGQLITLDSHISIDAVVSNFIFYGILLISVHVQMHSILERKMNFTRETCMSGS